MSCSVTESEAMNLDGTEATLKLKEKGRKGGGGTSDYARVP